MPRTLTFNRLHKNGWYSYKVPGVAGALFVDSRMLTDNQKANMPQTLDVELEFQAEGAGATDAQREKAEKKAAADAKKAERAAAQAAKAAAKLEKLQAAALKAQEKAAAVAAKVAAATSSDAPAADAPATE